MIIDAMQSNLWASLYNGIRREFYDHNIGMTRADMEQHLASMNIHVIKDPADGRWKQIELPDGCELTMLLLKFGRGGRN